jgi:DNA polymerase (family 10)
LRYYEAGVNIARKGWIEADSLINTRDVNGIKRWFSERL